MYALKQKKPRYLIKNILDDLYDWVLETWEENYASYRVQKWSNELDEEICTNEHEFYSTMCGAIEHELKEDFENEIRSCVSNMTDKQCERVMKWMGLVFDGNLYDYPMDALQDNDEFIDIITKKFIYRKLNIVED